ncbi:Coenzyme F420-dependent N5,N10-methylene tetrahydromethanopterin reductase [Actinokineospora spheciospongiae]|uniref:Coenzyme F420-dependent N5,N10-methylene tetrahydromethanopterin reductase n=1 Tax=Actinokineospora spheciospongiae TaxID=909613 RepID=W7IY27_9PSEU|nr:LLM class F420-dependent oxidoreductase [Actinokineospora spheciospongiae]EWC58949.1 Coenzyme F420-dependent N5,N10-methylene tetrahydromethanopterin reductase [Actinokineospora spheciospongiae]
MTAELGRVGVWSGAHLWTDGAEHAAELEELGFTALWLGGSPGGDLAVVDALLGGTAALAVGTSIVSIWTDGPAGIATAFDRISTRFPGRFVLGLGASHAALVESVTDKTYEKPYSKLVDYLDQLAVPMDSVALAALGPRTVKLAGARTRGALPYLVTPEHTARARELLGAGPLLAPEQHVVLETDPARARELARGALAMYLGLPNYVNNWRRLGFTEDDVKGSDRLVDALVAWGDEEAIRERVAEHHAAGADHVAIQVVTADGGLDFAAYRSLAAALTG